MLKIAPLILLLLSAPSFAATICLALVHPVPRAEHAQIQLPEIPLLAELAFESPSIPRAASEFHFLPDTSSRMISETSSVDERWRFVHDFPIRGLVANPGHRVIRRPEAAEDIALHIRLGDFPIDLGEKGPAVNIVTDPTGRVLSIDLWEGHHRMLGQVVAGRETLGQLHKEELRIYVNGKVAPDFQGASRPHIVPAFGVDFRSSLYWIALEDGEGRDLGQTYRTRPDPSREGKNKDVIVSGQNSNFMLGSRETVGMVLENIQRKEQADIGIFFIPVGGSLPSSAEIEALLEKSKLSDLVFAWRGRGASPIELHQLKDWNRRLSGGGRSVTVNAYQGLDVDEFIGKHGEKPFRQRIQQIFSTTHEAKILESRP